MLTMCKKCAAGDTETIYHQLASMLGWCCSCCASGMFVFQRLHVCLVSWIE